MNTPANEHHRHDHTRDPSSCLDNDSLPGKRVVLPPKERGTDQRDIRERDRHNSPRHDHIKHSLERANMKDDELDEIDRNSSR